MTYGLLASAYILSHWKILLAIFVLLILVGIFCPSSGKGVLYETKRGEDVLFSTRAATLEEALVNHSMKLHNLAYDTEKLDNIALYIDALQLTYEDAVAHNLLSAAQFIQEDIDDIKDLYNCLNEN